MVQVFVCCCFLWLSMSSKHLPTSLTHVHTHLPPPVNCVQPKDTARICEERQSFRANLGTLGADTRYDAGFDVALMCTCGCSYALRCKLLQPTCKWPSHAFALSLSLSPLPPLSISPFQLPFKPFFPATLKVLSRTN